jgi:hypothetical protein
VYRYYFDDDITVETTNNLVERLQAVESKIELWFSTNGGDTSAMSFFVRFLNSRKDDITVVLTDRVYSAGTFILTDFKGKIKIKDLDAVLFHLVDRESYNLRKDGYTLNSKTLTKQDKEYNKIFAEKIKNKRLLTNKQLKQLLNGKDVVVYQKQLKKWEQ